MAKYLSRFILLRRFLEIRNYFQSVQQFIAYYQRMLGDIYYWRSTEKALLISGTALFINALAELIAVFTFFVNPAGLSMNVDNLFWGIKLFAFNLFILSASSAASYFLRYKDALQTPLLVLSLTCLVISMALFSGSVGFFDGVTWQLFFLFNAALIVFLDRRWVVGSFVSLLVLMIWMTFNEELLPFPVRAIRLTPQTSLADIGMYQLIFEWGMLLWVGGIGIVIVDFFLSAWRNRDTDLRSKSYTDELTRLMNRRAVLESLSEEYRRALRVGYPLSIAVLDLDRFKKINDTYGHPFGDRVLKGVAKELESVGRKNDLAGRYGGEEFIIVFPECNAKVATNILERLRERIENMEFETDQGEKVSVTISAGVAKHETADEDYLQIIARADFALYRAKEFGRNQVLSIEIEDNEQLAFLDRI